MAASRSRISAAVRPGPCPGRSTGMSSPVLDLADRAVDQVEGPFLPAVGALNGMPTRADVDGAGAGAAPCQPGRLGSCNESCDRISECVP